MKISCLEGVAKALELTLDQVKVMDYMRPYFKAPSTEQAGFVILDLEGNEYIIPYWIEDFSKVAAMKGKIRAPIVLA